MVFLKFIAHGSMSAEQLQGFLAKAKADSSLQSQISAEGADIVDIAKKSGFEITQEDLESDQELSNLELKNVAGGAGKKRYEAYGENQNQ